MRLPSFGTVLNFTHFNWNKVTVSWFSNYRNEIHTNFLHPWQKNNGSKLCSIKDIRRTTSILTKTEHFQIISLNSSTKLVTLPYMHTSASTAAQFRSPLTKQCINADTSQHWPTVNDGGRPLEHINLDHATVEDDTTREPAVSNAFPDDEGDDRDVTLANWRMLESFSCGFGSWLCNGVPCQLIDVVLFNWLVYCEHAGGWLLISIVRIGEFFCWGFSCYFLLFVLWWVRYFWSWCKIDEWKNVWRFSHGTFAICWSRIELSLQIIRTFLKRLVFGLILRPWFHLIVN